ncbi:hypothetical protein B9Z55_000307 [Caenorhabditis nigoni]|uniref:Uncharacterized protein n=1 Tax=Caenorhabditis nigoni TaxID=1611254 RepID=A0A2G5VNE2_9PELO|nr:hypothetical protein B9Z55_000307 [Caenorhabditis nigoni]
MQLYAWDNPRLATRKWKIFSFLRLLQFYALVFMICGVLQFGISIFYEKISGKPDPFFSYFMIAEAYVFAILIWTRSRIVFVIMTFYFAFRAVTQLIFHISDNPEFSEISRNSNFLENLDFLRQTIQIFSTILYCSLVILFPIIAFLDIFLLK